MTPETGPCLATIDGQPEIAAIALALHEALADSRTSKDLAHALAVFLSRRGFPNVVVGTLAFGKQIIAKISTRLNGIPEGYLLFDPSGRRHPRILDNPEPCHYRSPPSDDSLAACMSLPDAMNMPDREWLELPILSGQQLWGVVYADRGGAPISNDNFAEACNISAIASQYVELVNARETRVNIARAQHELRKIDLSLAQVIYRIYHPDEASSLFHTIASAVVAATGCVCCDITMADKGKYEAVAQDGALSPIGLSLSDSEALCAHSLTIRAITSGEFQYILGPRTDPMYQAMMEKAAPGQRPLLRNIALWAAFPIRIGATVVGAISVCSPSREFLLPWRREVIKEFAEKTGLALSLGELAKRHEDEVELAQAQRAETAANLYRVGRFTAHAQVARSMVHNIGNLLTPTVYALDEIRKSLSRSECKHAARAFNL